MNEILIIQQNLILLKYRHWKIITFKMQFISSLIKFIQYFDNNKCYGNCFRVCYDSAFILLLHWLYYHNKWKIKYKSNSKYKNKLFLHTKQIKKLQSTLNKRNKYLPYLIKYKESKNIIDQYALKYWRKKSLTKQCLREQCNVRKEMDEKYKFVKCSNCFVAIYCSRKCAKIDWNSKHGFHKKYCHKLRSGLGSFIYKFKSSQQSHEFKLSDYSQDMECQDLRSTAIETLLQMFS